MIKQIVVAFLIMLGVISALAFTKYLQVSAAIAQSANFAPPPEAITSIIAKEQSWPQLLTAIGSLSPSQGIVVSSEEPGKVVKLGFESGQQVKEGDLLVELDTSVEQSDLNGAIARAERARKNFTRMKELKPGDVISQDAFDNSQSELQQADAEVASLRARIAKKQITAPFSGRTGIRMVNIGQYVSPGAELVPLHALEKMFLNFSIPQQEVSKLSTGMNVTFSVDAYPGESFQGQVTSINPVVDPITRNISIQATINNPNEKLRSGMFAVVSLALGKEENFITLPSTSINYAPYGDAVYVVEEMKGPDGKSFRGVRQQIVKVGPKRGEQIAIISGIKPGEEIATSGLFKLRPGAAVQIDNSFAPSNNLQPTPSDS